MQLVCSHCHTHFEAKADESEPHIACPTCRAEIGFEPAGTKAAPAMRYFGSILAVAAILVFMGSFVALISR